MTNFEECQEENMEKIHYYTSTGKLYEKLAHEKDVSLVYGEPIKHETNTVIPLAKMKYTFAGSGGASSAKGKRKRKLHARGEGNVGRISVKPIGVYEINKEKVRFKPIIDSKLLATIGSFLTLGLALLLRKRK